MVSRVSVEGYNPEYYEGYDARQINAGEYERVILYAIPVGYLFNLTGFIVTCNKPGANDLIIGKYDGNAHLITFDGTFAHYMPQGLLTVLQYGDSFTATISNEMSYNALFWLSVQGILEFEG